MVVRSHTRRASGDTPARGPTRGSDAARGERTGQPLGQELSDALMGPPTFGAGQMNFAYALLPSR
jgi:hypothetical protein